MKYITLFLIHLYWLFIPEHKRRNCIFKKSCSQAVFEDTQEKGFIYGLKTFHFRFKNCRAGFELFTEPITNEVKMVLPSKVIIEKDEIAERLLTK